MNDRQIGFSLRNILLSLIFGLALLSPISMWLADQFDLSLPSWLSPEDARYLEGKKPITGLPVLGGVEGFQSGQAQLVLKDYIDAYAPAKASMLLGNAALQRDMIEMSNFLFGWDCYPTYYGSNIVYSPSMNRLSAFPVKRTGGGDIQAYKSRYEGFFNGLSEVAQEFPDTNFYIYIADAGNESQFNFAHSLVTDTETLEDIVPYFQKEFSFLENVHIEYDYFLSTDDCYERRYASDMHWNFYGALKAYNKLAAISQMQPLSEDLTSTHITDFYGGASRSGRMLVKSSGDACDIEFSDLDLMMEDGGIDEGDKHLDYYAADIRMQHMNWYETYYGYGLSPEIKGPGNDQALLMTDSFGAGIKRYIANQYDTTLVRWSLAGKKYVETLKELIRDNGIDDVYFIGLEYNYATYKEGKEGFFD